QDAINDGFVRFQGNGDGTFKAPTSAKPIQGYYGVDSGSHPIWVGNVIQNMVHGQFGGLPSVVWDEWIAGGGGAYILCNLPDKYFATDFGATECSITVDPSGQVQGLMEFPPPLVLGRVAYATPKDFAFTSSPTAAGLFSGSLLGATHDSTPPPPFTAGFS